MSDENSSANTFKKMLPLYKESYAHGKKAMKGKHKFLKLKEILRGRTK